MANRIPVDLPAHAWKTTPESLAMLITLATIDSTSITAVAEHHRPLLEDLPHGDTALHHLTNLTPHAVLAFFDEMQTWILAQAKARGALHGPKLAALDGHRKPYDGEPTRLTTNGDKKHGTRQAHELVTLELVDKLERFTLAAWPTTPFTSTIDRVPDTLDDAREHAEHERVLKHKQFCTTPTLTTLHERGQGCGIAAPLTKNRSAVFVEHEDEATRVHDPPGTVERILAVPYTMTGQAGEVLTTLILRDRRDTDTGRTERHAWVTDVEDSLA